MGSVHARGDTFLTFGLKALTETNTSRLATGTHTSGGEVKADLPKPPPVTPVAQALMTVVGSLFDDAFQ
jgi:hypothetical protein